MFLEVALKKQSVPQLVPKTVKNTGVWLILAGRWLQRGGGEPWTHLYYKGELFEKLSLAQYPTTD